jgi:endonuclease/exonuclease/phosphatase family metal-dependent hydrolase
MQTLRVLTLNLWNDREPADRRMELIVEGLRALAPDVVALQEVCERAGKTPNQAVTLATACGYRSLWRCAMTHEDKREGVALLARHPILESDSVVLPAAPGDEDRVVLRARIETPAGPVDCYSTHLSYRLTDGLARERQVLAIDELVQPRAGDAVQVVMGDFNAAPDCDEVRFMRGLCTLGGRRTYYQDAYAQIHAVDPPAGSTWSSRNPSTEWMHWLPRDRRIDYIFVSPAGRDRRGTVLGCELAFDNPGADGVFASDHFGVMADLQIAPTREAIPGRR